MLIAELLENCQNDAERLILLNTLKKQIDVLEKPIKEKLVKLKLKHSHIKYIERKDWVPSQKYETHISFLKERIKETVEESKTDREGGSYKISTCIKVIEPKPKKETQSEPIKSPDMDSFFMGNPNNFNV